MSVVPFCILALLATGVAGAIRARARDGGSIVYDASLGLCVILGLTSLLALSAPPATPRC